MRAQEKQVSNLEVGFVKLQPLNSATHTRATHRMGSFGAFTALRSIISVLGPVEWVEDQFGMGWQALGHSFQKNIQVVLQHAMSKFMLLPL